MPNPFQIREMASFLRRRDFPTVTVWNRLEGRPRTTAFDRALRAEVRDALWLLARQWQLGELNGDDAGSPITATMRISRTPLDAYRSRDAIPVTIDETLPLEAVVERRAVPFEAAGLVGSLDLRVALGRRWLKLVPIAYRAAYVSRYGFAAPDAADPAQSELAAHLEVRATLQALAGRAMDGYRLYEHLSVAGNRAYDGMTVANADKPALDAAAERFAAWVDGLVLRPTSEPSWDPSRLEHRFSVSADVEDGEKRLLAEEYPGGRLDWSAFSLDPASAEGGGRLDDAVTVFPEQVQFDGMPNARWWAFEDGRTNFGDVGADTTDLGKLLFLEFALIYGNDWFLMPVDLPVGCVARVEGLAVTNVFGERLWIEPAGAGADDDPRRWAMFGLDWAGLEERAADSSLLLLPTVPKVHDGPPLEEVALIRDEVANMVWGIERTVPLATGEGRRGAEAAAETLAHRTRLAAATPGGAPPPAAPVAYRAMQAPPEHWIPFVPVQVPNDVREIQLQRAALPRIIEGAGAPERVRPRTTLLREGLDGASPASYYLHEEEVPRAGTQVSLAYQRTRWRDGRVVVWLAARRGSGRGEGSSGLAFDQLVETRSD